MKLYLLRHAPAEDGSGYRTDGERPLSDEGRERMKLASDGLAYCIESVSSITSSPLLRARQTADLAAKAIGYSGQLQTSKSLEPEATIEGTLQFIESLPRSGDHLVVGHMPNLPLLAATLLGARMPVIEFKRGALVCIELQTVTHPGTLRFAIAPGQLRKMRK